MVSALNVDIPDGVSVHPPFLIQLVSFFSGFDFAPRFPRRLQCAVPGAPPRRFSFFHRLSLWAKAATFTLPHF